MRVMRRILNAVTTILVVLAVVFAVALVGVRAFGMNAYAVLSGSMEPAYPVGSLVYVQPVSTDNIQVGDTITFMASETMVATHRVVEVVAEDGQGEGLAFRTKGDANDTPDASLVQSENVIGKVVFSLPLLGYFANFIQNPLGTYIAIAIGALLVLIAVVPALFAPSNKKDATRADATDTPAHAAKGAASSTPAPPLLE